MKFLKKLYSYIQYLLTKPFKKPPVPYQLNADFIIPIIKREVRKDVVTVLDVGCGMLYDNNPASEDILLSCFADKRYKVAGFDIFEEAVAFRKKGYPKGEYFVMDARNLNSLTQRYDLVMAHHVIEHLTKEEGLTLLKNIEKVAIKQIIIGTPIGFVNTDYAVALHNNEHDRHHSGWQPLFFENRGYTIYQDPNIFLAIKNITD